jgi:Pyridoxamine 5'-phosphate oxidase
VNQSASPLTREECLARLSSREVARVSVSIEAMPVIMPVVYLVDDDSVLFRAPLDGGLAEACDGAVIAFEVDDLSPSSVRPGGWSVHIVGVGSRLEPPEQLQGLSLGGRTMTAPDLDQVVRLKTVRLRGHELRATPLASAG